MKKKFKNVVIPASLHERIEEKIKGSAFQSVSDYIIRILTESLSREEPGQGALNKEDEEKIKQRLKALGYLD